VTEGVHGLVDHLFRHSAGQMVATLTRILGAENLSLAEEVVQDALVKALQQWAIRGVPANPAAWLFQVARNGALDQLRRRKKPILVDAVWTDPEDPAFAHELRDDQLRMMLMCCHPAIPEESRVALTLKTVGAFSVDEIARAYLAKTETIAQRIVRAKRLIRDKGIAMDLPSRLELPARIESLLQVLYLMFNEGYTAHAGDELVRADICHEAIRMTRLIAGHRAASTPAAHALLALMLFQAARLPARIDAAGELATLAEQDRSRWDRAMIMEGMGALDASATGETVTPLHLEAGIAAAHAVAASFETTDWRQVVDLYNELYEMKPTPVVALNRAVAIAMSEGAASGIAAIEDIADHSALHDYLPYAATLGELWLRAGESQRAATHFARALELPGTAPEKRFLLRKLQQCRG
jgi:RNA polymerase sigma-70 factor (ECF subfamily)